MPTTIVIIFQTIASLGNTGLNTDLTGIHTGRTGQSTGLIGWSTAWFSLHPRTRFQILEALRWVAKLHWADKSVWEGESELELKLLVLARPKREYLTTIAVLMNASASTVPPFQHDRRGEPNSMTGTMQDAFNCVMEFASGVMENFRCLAMSSAAAHISLRLTQQLFLWMDAHDEGNHGDQIPSTFGRKGWRCQGKEKAPATREAEIKKVPSEEESGRTALERRAGGRALCRHRLGRFAGGQRGEVLATSVWLTIGVPSNSGPQVPLDDVWRSSSLRYAFRRRRVSLNDLSMQPDIESPHQANRDRGIGTRLTPRRATVSTRWRRCAFHGFW
ncbi:hypothetical protein BC830DRAFT_1079788 [Chytriomyces sp. MP71]|nr:hypothetical protein BC830DRAFT_1079788 [Chytriomyces sp. MP71]